MKPIYLYDVGIKLWEQRDAVSDNRFATITIVHRSINEFSDLWFMLAEAISKVLPRVLKWRTVGYCTQGSKVQELKLIKKLRSDISNDGYIEKNESSNIYSYVKRLALNEIDLNSFSQPRYTAILFLPNDALSDKVLWEILKKSDAGLESKGIESFLHSCPDLLVCRFSESDTHVSLQLIGVVDKVDLLLDILKKLKIDKIESDNVAGLING